MLNFTSNPNIILFFISNLGKINSLENCRLFLLEDEPDCTKLPTSLNGPEWQKGCPGAVYSGSGAPAQEYCENYSATKSSTTYWYEKCCKWTNNRCLPKPDDGKYES